MKHARHVTPWVRGVALALLCLLLLAGCSTPATVGVVAPIVPTPTPVPAGRGSGDTLRILYWQAPDILNPHLTANPKDSHASRVTYEPLASFNKDGEMIPFLAAEIPSLDNGGVAQDGRSVTWTLREGVLWSDGQPFTADDVLFTYEFISNPEVGAATASTYDGIERVEVVDDHTVRLHFTDVTPAWFLPFVGLQGMILPRHIFEPFNGPDAREAPANLMPVGTGPYRVIKFRPEEVLFLGNELIQTNKIVFEPNPYFREEDKPFFRRVELKGGGTPTEAARSSLQTGDVDYAWYLQVDGNRLAELQGGRGEPFANPGSYVEHILINLTDPRRITADGERSSLEFPHPFLSDLRVRQAISYAVDRDAIAALYPGSQVASNILVAPANYSSPNTGYTVDLKRAATLLSEAGWRDSDGDGIRDRAGEQMTVSFVTTSNPIRQQIQAIVKDSLEAIGIGVELRISDASVIFSSDTANPHNYHQFPANLMEYADGNYSPDPGAYMRYWTCEQIPQKANGWTRGKRGAVVQSLLRCAVRTIYPRGRPGATPATVHPHE